MIVFRPKFRNSRKQLTAHQSNSTELPIRYTPDPRKKKKKKYAYVQFIENYILLLTYHHCVSTREFDIVCSAVVS